ncbi:MAG: cell division protein ZapE [Alteromonadaceae bacterium]|jgi:cell division protein ZapE
MALIPAYQKLLADKNLSYDPAQAEAIQALNTLIYDLQHPNKKFWTGRSKKQYQPKGIYFHGRVGRGKTMLMDLFYQHIKIKHKKRLHFHRFMEVIHQQLDEVSGQSEPLNIIAKRWASEIKLLCFDEFFVTDIGDAMLMSGLLNAFFQYGVVLVTTSNCHPDLLYRNGLQRQRFTPTIVLLKAKCHIISIDGEVDHRLSHHKQQMSYRDYSYPNDNLHTFIKNRYLQLSLNKSIKQGVLQVLGRDITYLAKDGALIWFDFFALCSGPRSQRDYINIADNFSTVLISNIPQFSGKPIPAVFSGVEDSYQRSGVLMGDLRLLDDEARRFIALVDEFYDRKIRLVVSAEVDIVELYQGQQLSFEFSRCQSRLIEMQTIGY